MLISVLGAVPLALLLGFGWIMAFIGGAILASTDPVVRTRLNEYLDSLRHVRPSLDGNDLIALGVLQGPMVGRGLEALRDARLDGTVNSREQETELARSFVPPTEV